MEERDELIRAAAPEVSGREVLVVDDSPEDGERYAAMLAAVGARVEKVETLGAARMALGNHRWDILVIDRLLPDGDALEWLRIERRRNVRVPPCVMVSGHLDEKTYRSIYDAGAVPLPKHYILHSDVLIAAIGSALRLEQANANCEQEPAITNPLLPAEYRSRNRRS